MFFFFPSSLAVARRVQGDARDAKHARAGPVRRVRVRARQPGDGRRREADRKTTVVRGHGGTRAGVFDGPDHRAQRFRSRVREYKTPVRIRA